MSLSEIKGERVFDALADIIEPIANMAEDEKVIAFFKGTREAGENNKSYALRQMKTHMPYLLRNHKQNLLMIFAALDGVPADEYAKSLNLLTLPVKLLNLMNDKEIISLFISAERTAAKKASGDAGITPDEPTPPQTL